MALIFPTAAQAALQTPPYEYSPTSSPIVNTSNAFVYTYDAILGVWTSTASGGGGGGVSTVTGVAPITSTGGSSPAIDIDISVLTPVP